MKEWCRGWAANPPPPPPPLVKEPKSFPHFSSPPFPTPAVFPSGIRERLQFEKRAEGLAKLLLAEPHTAKFKQNAKCDQIPKGRMRNLENTDFLCKVWPLHVDNVRGLLYLLTWDPILYLPFIHLPLSLNRKGKAFFHNFLFTLLKSPRELKYLNQLEYAKLLIVYKYFEYSLTHLEYYSDGNRRTVQNGEELESQVC